jgi:glucose-1-phosphate thymidylyltransferase
MKALVLAGGHGTRLRPISHTMAKQLVPVANRPVLFYGLDAIRDAGITEVGMIVSDLDGDVAQAVGDGSAFGLSVTHLLQTDPLGLAHCVAVAEDFLGDDDFLMYLGDNVVAGGVSELVGQFQADQPDALVMVGKVAEPAEFGVAELGRDGRVVGVEEKSPHPRSDLALIGVYAFSPAVHTAVRSIKPSWRGELEITDAIGWLVGQGRDVHAHVCQSYWRDTGRVEDLLDCNRELLTQLKPRISGKVDDGSEIHGPVSVAEGAQVAGSRIVGPAIIGPGAVVTGSYVGPFTAVGAGCVLEDVGIEYSIVLDRSSVCSIRHIRGSLIGRDADIRPASPVPGGNQLVVGDHCRVLIQT